METIEHSSSMNLIIGTEMGLRFEGRVKTLGNTAVEARESATIHFGRDVSCKRRVKIQCGTVQPKFVTSIAGYKSGKSSVDEFIQ